MQASLEPVVEQPVASSGIGACHRSARIATQRRSISAVCGYSSLSIMFLSAQSDISGERLRLHPGGHERGQVEPGAAVQQQLVLDQLVGDVRRDRVVGQPVMGEAHLQPKGGIAPRPRNGLEPRR